MPQGSHLQNGDKNLALNLSQAIIKLKIEIICQKCFAKGKVLYKFKGIQLIDCDCESAPGIREDWLMGPGAKGVTEILCCALGGHQSRQAMPTAKRSSLRFVALGSHHGLAPGSGLGKSLGELQYESQGSRKRKEVASKAGGYYYYHTQK